MNKNRIFAVIAAAAMLCSLSACSGSKGEENVTEAAAASAAETAVTSEETEAQTSAETAEETGETETEEVTEEETQPQESGAEQSEPVIISSSDELMLGVFNALNAEGGEMEQLRQSDTYTVYSEELNDSAITVAAEGEYINGRWEFIHDGDYITASFPENDYMGAVMSTYIGYALCDTLGIDKDLYRAYVSYLTFSEEEGQYYSVKMNEDGSSEMKLYTGKDYDFSELDGVYIDEKALSDIEPLGDDDINHYISCGKVNMFSLGNRNSVEITFAEYGDLSNLTYKSVIETVKKLQPAGYEEFIENYTALEEANTDAYTVTFPEDKADLPEFYGELAGRYKFVKVTFGEGNS